MQQLESAASSVSSNPKQDIHTLYCILKYCIASQFNHALRICLPSLTAESANKLDNICIKFLSKITKTEEVMDNLSNEEKLNVINKIFLTTNRSGMGITSSLRSSKAAFIGSISLCAHWMTKIIPDLQNETVREEKSILSLPTFKEYNNIFNQFKDEMPDQLNHINIDLIWNSQFHKVQHIISTEIQNKLLKVIENNLPQQSTVAPNSRYSQYS